MYTFWISNRNKSVKQIKNKQLMFVRYIFAWWEKDKGHMLIIDCHDPLDSTIRIKDNKFVTILANRCVINEKLSSKDYKDFFEVRGIDSPQPVVEFNEDSKLLDIITGYAIDERKLVYLVTKVIGRPNVTI